MAVTTSRQTPATKRSRANRSGCLHSHRGKCFIAAHGRSSGYHLLLAPQGARGAPVTPRVHMPLQADVTDAGAATNRSDGCRKTLLVPPPERTSLTRSSKTRCLCCSRRGSPARFASGAGPSECFAVLSSSRAGADVEAGAAVPAEGDRFLVAATLQPPHQATSRSTTGARRGHFKRPHRGHCKWRHGAAPSP